MLCGHLGCPTPLLLICATKVYAVAVPVEPWPWVWTLDLFCIALTTSTMTTTRISAPRIPKIIARRTALLLSSFFPSVGVGAST